MKLRELLEGYAWCLPDDLFEEEALREYGPMAVAGFRTSAGWIAGDERNVYEVAAVLRYFFGHLMSPVITDDVVNSLPSPCESYQCVRLANSLPNENRDTLMYLVGFLQDYIEAYSGANRTYSGANRTYAPQNNTNLAPKVVKALCPIMRGAGPGWPPEKIKLVEPFMLCLIDSWSTEEVYKAALAEHVERQLDDHNWLA
jgi:hypothetical protein